MEKKVLIVDDELSTDSSFGHDIIRAGEKAGISFNFLKISKEAVDILRSGHNYGLVLMDGQFDNCRLQGWDAVEEIRRFSNIPIIMISGSSDYNNKGIRNGADEAILKKDIPKYLRRESSKIKKWLSSNHEGVKKLLETKLSGSAVEHIISMLLSLDIDMQTLQFLHKEGKDFVEFLTEMYGDSVDYMQKLEELKKIIINNNALSLSSRSISLESLCFSLSVELFFSKLSEKEMDGNSLVNHDWELKGIKTFHDWYCILCEVLKGGNANG